ncbi:MAG: hypothetical protein WD070_08570, partial [Pirellulaceae bacterium]
MSHLFSRVSSCRPHREIASRKPTRQRRRRMFFETLEDRRMLASYNWDGAGNLSITLDQNEDLTIAESEGDRTFMIDAGTFTATGMSATGNATMQLTFSAGDIISNAISVDNAGAVGGTNHVTFAGGTIESGKITVNASQANRISTIDFTAETTLMGNVWLTSNRAAITDSTGSVSISGAASLTATGSSPASGNVITLDDADNDFVGAVSIVAHTATLRDANEIDFGSSDLASGGAFNVTAGGAITDSGVLTILGTTTITNDGHDITLNGTWDGESGERNSFVGAVSVTGANVTLVNMGTIELIATTVTGDFVVDATGQILNNFGDISVTGNAKFKGTKIALGGDGLSTDFGSLTFDKASMGVLDVTIHEDSDTVLTGENKVTNGSLTLSSSGSITHETGSSLNVSGTATFHGESISLGNTGPMLSTNFGRLNFTSPGAVSITEDSSMLLSENSTAGSATLTSSSFISDGGGESLEVAGLLTLSGTSIDLFGTGTLNAGSLTFNSAGFVRISESSSTDIVGENTARSLNLQSTGAISDAGATSIDVTNLANVNGTSISLGGGTFNTGTLTFTSSGAVVIREDSTMDLVGVNTAASANLNSQGTISDGSVGTDITVTGSADFAGTSITIGGGAGEVTNFGSLTASASTESISISEDSTMDINAITAGTSVVLTSETGAIVDNNDALTNITAASLALIAATGIGNGDALETMVNSLEGTAGADGFNVTNTGGLIIGGVSGSVSGINASGPIQVLATGPLTVNEDVIGTSEILLNSKDDADDAVGKEDDLTISSGATVQSTGGNVILRGGDDVTLAAGSIVDAAGKVSIDGNFENADGAGSTINVLGVLKTVTRADVFGGVGGDTINLAPEATSSGAIRLDGQGGDDTYTVQLGLLGGQVDVTDQSSPGTDELIILGTGSPDTLTIDASTTTLASPSQTVTYLPALDQLEVRGGDGGDTFNVTPSTTALITVLGGDPTALPGDMLNYATPSGQAANDQQSGPDSGTIGSTGGGGYQDVDYGEIERVALTGAITITGTAQNDDLTITATGANSGSYVLTSNGVAGPTVTFTDMTSLTFNGNAGNDKLTIAHGASTALFAPSGGVAFNGGGQTAAPGDQLEVTGSMLSLNAMTSTHTTTGADGNDGTLDLDSLSITYTGLEPVLVDVGAIGTVEFNLPAGADAVLSDDGTVGNNISEVTSNIIAPNAGAFEDTTFTNPSTALIINAGAGSDAIEIAGLDSLFDADLEINSSLGTEAVNVDVTAAINIDFDADGQIATIGTVADPVATIDFVAGSIVTTGGTINLNTTGAIATTTTAVDVTGATLVAASSGGSIDIDTAVDAITASVIGGNMLTIDEADAVTLTSVTSVDGNIDISGAVSSAGALTATSVVASGTGEISLDTVTAASDVLVNSVLAADNLITINANGAIDETDADGAIDLDARNLMLTAVAGIGELGTIEINASGGTGEGLTAEVTGTGGIAVSDQDAALRVLSASTSNGSISIAAVGTLTLESVSAGGVGADVDASTTGGDVRVQSVEADGDRVTLTASAAVTDDDSADDNDILAAELLIVSESGIGASGNFLETTVSKFEAIVSTSTTGGVYIDNVGNLEVGNINGITGVSTQGGDIALYVSGGSLTISETVNSNGGSIELESDGAAGDIDINASILSGGGAVDVEADANITFSAAGSIDVESGTPTVTLLADVDTSAGGGITMADVSLVNARGGAIVVEATDDIRLSSLQTTAGVTVDSSSGSILDNGDTDDELVAATAVLNAGGTVGEPDGTNRGPLDTQLANLEGDAGGGGFFIDNSGDLTIGGINGVIGISSTDTIVVRNAGVMDVTENVTATTDIELVSLSLAGAQPITVAGGVTVAAGNDLFLPSSDDLDLQDSSIVQAGNQIQLFGDFNDVDAEGAIINLFGTLNAEGIAGNIFVFGGPNGDQINVDPQGTHTADGITLDGTGGNDTYRIWFGNLNGGTNAVIVVEAGPAMANNDQIILQGTDDTSPAGEIFNIDGPNGGTVENVTHGETVNYPEGVERLLVRGNGGNDTFTGSAGDDAGVEPSFSTIITIDGGAPGFGDPHGPGGSPDGTGDRMIFDPLNNTFQIIGQTIFTDGDGDFQVMGAGDYKGVNFRNIESLPLMPQAETPALRFDFDAPSLETQSGYTSVAPARLYGTGTADSDFGWVTTAPATFDRGNVLTTTFEDLLQDGHFLTTPSTFRADVMNGWHLVSIKMGDTFGHDQMQVKNADTGQVLLAGVANAAGQFPAHTFVVQVTDSTLDLEISDLGNEPHWVINALEIRPGEILTFGSPDPGTLVADGFTEDTFLGFEATPDELITISASMDVTGDDIPDGPLVVSSPDMDPKTAGVQVLASPTGTFSYTVRRPSARGTGFVKMEHFTGTQTGGLAIDYVSPNIRRFDFNSPTSPTQTPLAANPNPPDSGDPTGYAGVLGTNLYRHTSGTRLVDDPRIAAARGYGWTNQVGTFDRGPESGAQADLRRDAHFLSTAQTFATELAAGDYLVHVTLGDADPARDNIEIRANGVLVPGAVNTAAGSWAQKSFNVSIGATGLLELEFRDTGGEPHWVVNGLEIRELSLVGTHTLTPIGDGTTVSGSGATPGSLITVATTVGSIASATADDDPNYAGVQVTADSNGDFSFTISSSLGGAATVSSEEVTGRGRGSEAITLAGPIIIDNVNPDGGGFTSTGFTYFTQAGFQNDLHYSPGDNNGDTATWTFDNLTPGTTYRISATWIAHSNRATDSPFTISGVDG